MEKFEEYYDRIGNMFGIERRHLVVGNYLRCFNENMRCGKLNKDIEKLSRSLFSTPPTNIFISELGNSKRIPENAKNLVFFDMRYAEPDSKEMSLIRESVSHCTLIPMNINESSIITHATYRYIPNHITGWDNLISEIRDAAIGNYTRKTLRGEKSESLKTKLDGSKNSSCYVLLCSNDEMEEISNRLKKNNLEHIVFFVLTPYPGFDRVSNRFSEEIFLRSIECDNTRELIGEYLSKNPANLYRNTFYGLKGVTKVENIPNSAMPTQLSLKTYRGKYPDIDPLKVLLDIVNSKNNCIVIKFKFDSNNKDAESNSMRTEKMIAKLYESGNGYMLRNSWHTVPGKKILKGGSVVVKTEAFVNTIKMLKLYGCMSGSIGVTFYPNFEEVIRS